MRNPDYIIAGVMRGGTTSLHTYLQQHPDVIKLNINNTHFLTPESKKSFYNKGIDWYRKQFKAKEGQYVGELTPRALFSPSAPYIIKKRMYKNKIIILLRNPIDRAYSHYWYNINSGREKLSFEEAIKQEKDRINKGNTDYMRYSYLSQSKYSEHIKRWLELFNKKRLLILKSEDFFTNPKEVLFKVQKFIGLSKYNLKEYPVIYKEQKKPKIKKKTYNELEEYFEPHNKELYKLMKIKW